MILLKAAELLESLTKLGIVTSRDAEAVERRNLDLILNRLVQGKVLTTHQSDTMIEVTDRLADFAPNKSKSSASWPGPKPPIPPQPVSPPPPPTHFHQEPSILAPPTRQDCEAPLQSFSSQSQGARLASKSPIVAPPTRVQLVAPPDPPEPPSSGLGWIVLTVAAILLVLGLFLWMAIQNRVEKLAEAPTTKPADPPKPTPPPIKFAEQIGIKMVPIPAGEFMMGSNNGDSDEKPVHKVKISAFEMTAHELTRGQFAKFVADTNYKTEAETNGKGGYGYDEAKKTYVLDPKYNWKNPGFSQTDDHPVVNISRNDTKKFVEWLSRKDGRTFRLPREAEWEYACRAGSTTKYSFGDNEEELPKHANLGDASLKRRIPGWPFLTIKGDDGHPFTAPVGRFEANKFGLFDMHGNVWEWCEDAYESDYYKKSDESNPVNSAGLASTQVLRGGGWGYCLASFARSADRDWCAPSFTSSSILGFRVVASDR